MTVLVDAHAIASAWLYQFAHAMEAADVSGLVSTILPKGYLRDILVFTWNYRTLHGHSGIFPYLKVNLARAHISNTLLDERTHFAPTYGRIGPIAFGVSFGFTFESPIAKGQGYARLLQDGHGDWKALCVFMMVDELKGHPELGPESGVYGSHTVSWESVRDERVRRIENEPCVLVVGAGQTGLNIASRLKQMEIPTLLIEQSPRVGDVWRKRYPTLVLHTPRPHHSFNYHPFPETWPIFTPKDKLADWMEQYAISQDLVVWTSSTLQPMPTYDTKSRKWTCTVSRAGTDVILRPSHIIMAAGTLGEPNIPDIPTASVFQGEMLHTAAYQGGLPYINKRVVVIGAGNSAADVCQDLVVQGAKSVMMVQRSATAVVSAEKKAKVFAAAFPRDVPVAVSDFKFSSQPWPMLREFAIEAGKLEERDSETEMLERLVAKGVKLTKGKDGSGQLFLVFERLGGYWWDAGVSDLIYEDKIVLKQGVEVSRFTQDTVVFSDGSEHDADVVVYATGYRSILDSLKSVFGEKVISKTPYIWGFDDEQELRGCYRPSGQPGLWYGAGDFYTSRFFSKPLVNSSF